MRRHSTHPSPHKTYPTHDLEQALQQHQVELEHQNDELRRTQSDLAAARDRYLDLYDFAPVGYLTLDTDGRILEVNRTGATLLGMMRHHDVRSEDFLRDAHHFDDLSQMIRAERGVGERAHHHQHIDGARWRALMPRGGAVEHDRFQRVAMRRAQLLHQFVQRHLAHGYQLPLEPPPEKPPPPPA